MPRGMAEWTQKPAASAPGAPRRRPAGPGRPDRDRRDPPRRGVRGQAWRRSSQGLFVPATVDATDPDQRVCEAAACLPAYGGVTGWAGLRWGGATWFDGRDAAGRERPVVLAVMHGEIRTPARACRDLRAAAAAGPDRARRAGRHDPRAVGLLRDALRAVRAGGRGGPRHGDDGRPGLARGGGGVRRHPQRLDRGRHVPGRAGAGRREQLVRDGDLVQADLGAGRRASRARCATALSSTCRDNTSARRT